MGTMSEMSELNEFAAFIIRTDFSDEAAWREVTAELERSSHYDDPTEHYCVVDAPDLEGVSADAILEAMSTHEELWEQRTDVVFIADGTTMRASHRALLAVTTLTREDFDEDEDYEATVEFGCEFRTEPGGVHSIHASIELSMADFHDFSRQAHEDPEGVCRFGFSRAD
jgi:hypothetical protein